MLYRGVTVNTRGIPNKIQKHLCGFPPADTKYDLGFLIANPEFIKVWFDCRCGIVLALIHINNFFEETMKIDDCLLQDLFFW